MGEDDPTSSAKQNLDPCPTDVHHATGDLAIAGLMIVIDNRVVFANDETSLILAVDFPNLAEDVCELMKTFIHPEDIALLQAASEARIEGRDSSNHFELRVIRGDGKKRWIELQLTSLEYNGEPATLAHFTDVTKRVEKRLREKKHARELEMLSQLALDLVELSIEDDIFAFVAQKLQVLSGAAMVTTTEADREVPQLVVRAAICAENEWDTLESHLGWNPINYAVHVPSELMNDMATRQMLHRFKGSIHELSYNTVPEAVAQAMETLFGVRRIYSISFARRGHLLGTANLFMNVDEEPNRRVIEAFAHQVSGALVRYYGEKHRQQLTEQLRVSQRLESVGRLAGGVAHEFNNLLTAIDGNVSVALLQTDKNDQLAPALQDIKRAAMRGSSLTTQMLALSRQHIYALKVIDLNQVVQEMESMLLPLLGETIIFNTVLHEEPVLILADRGQVEQVIMNLALNARDAMAEGGTLELQTSYYDILDDTETALKPTPPPDSEAPQFWWRLTATDTGHGMDEETQQKIFEPFFTTKPVNVGTGLGLSVVYGIIKQHRGMVTVKSTPGCGTSISIYFPGSAERHIAVTTPPPTSGVAMGRGTILMVEDDVLVRRVNRRILGHLGYRVIEASNGAEGLEVAKSYEGELDLLFTDVIMPQMNGFELAERIRSQRPSIKVLFTSGYARHATSAERFLAEGLEFIAKPYTPDQLAERIQAVLQSEIGNDETDGSG